jgi:hypothetical protein
MNQVEVIARRILGWNLNRWDRWYDPEKEVFIHEFNPEQNLEHALLIVEKLQQLGFAYKVNGDTEVCFNDACAKGTTLAEAITNAAFLIADNTSVPDEWL